MAQLAEESAAGVRGRTIVRAAELSEPPGWSHAVKAGGWIFGSGLMAFDAQSGAPLSDSNTAPFMAEPMGLQGEAVLRGAERVLAAAGADIRKDLIRLWQWMPASYPAAESYRATRSHWPCFTSGTPYARALGDRVGDPKRSSTGIGVRQLPACDALLALDFIALDPKAGLEKRGVAAPDGVPQPRIGYSPATVCGDWVFMAGFGATDFQGDWMGERHMGEPSMIAPEARTNPYIWLGSEIEAQTEFTLAALAKIAEAAGSSLARCVKADVTITHPDDFAGMDRVWRKYFPEDPPARNVVTGAQLVIKGLRVEIALVLLTNDSRLERRSLHVAEVPSPAGHAPQAMKAGDFVFFSSQLPIDAGGVVPDEMRANPALPYYEQPARRQTEMILHRVGSLCEAAGGVLAGVCKVQAFFDDLSHMPAMLSAWREAFPSNPPALSAVAMGGGDPLLAPGAHVQLDVIAYAPGPAASRRS